MLALAAGSLLAQGAQPPRAAGPPGQPMHERMTQMLKQRLGLTDQQVTKLEAAHQKHAEQQRTLRDQAREIRMALRDEMLRTDTARSAQLNSLLDRQMQLGRQRLELAEAQQKELAMFLSPIQRVKLGAAVGAMRHRRMGERMGRRGGHGGAMPGRMPRHRWPRDAGMAGRGMMGHECMGMMGGQMGPGGQGMGRMMAPGGQGMGGMMGPGGRGMDRMMGAPRDARVGPPAAGRMRRIAPPPTDSTTKKPEN